MTGPRTHLLIIDPQNDFCDLPPAYCGMLPNGKTASPTLPVAGAHADMLRLARLIDRAGTALTDITITLDSHHHNDIAHPPFWIQGDGSPVQAFTQIRAEDVRSGKYLPRQLSAKNRVINYLDLLEANGRYIHMVWPVHCEIGAWGNNVHQDVLSAYNRWKEKTSRNVTKIIKGTNPWTEHYSAIQAEVPSEEDASTLKNEVFIEHLKTADLLYIAGEASSHCVKSTVEHLANELDAKQTSKLVLLTDCMSPVAGFEKEASVFIETMQRKGAKIRQSTDIAPEMG